MHHPNMDGQDVLRRGRELVATWLERRWLAVLAEDSSTPVEATEALLEIVDQQGIAGTFGLIIYRLGTLDQVICFGSGSDPDNADFVVVALS